PRFIDARLRPTWVQQGVAVTLVDAAGHVLVSAPAAPTAQWATRSGQDTGLPWTLRVAGIGTRAELAQLAARRRLLLAGLALTALLTILGGVLTARATMRELAVARLESDFVSAVSHEFRSPLTALRHLTELLSSNDALPA